MTKTVRLYLLLALSIGGLLFFGASPAFAALIIDEFSPASAIEWVELFNADQVNSVSLTGYTIRNNAAATLKTLSGTVPRGGYLTFEFPTASLVNAGDCLFLWNGAANISSISYGTGTCTGGTNPGLAAPTSTQTGGWVNSAWAIVTTPTRGWCNDATGGCPPIATTVSNMNSFGVKSNLDSFADYSRTSGLYFQKSENNDPNGNPIGKITFLSEINFTDKDALTFLQTLGSKIDMSDRGKIGLDADLIKNLVSTNATLTMYGLGLIDPKIQVDGVDDVGVASGISYSGGTLTFTAAHFTTFGAVEKNPAPKIPSSRPCSGPCVPSCNDLAPTTAPNLFQIDSAGTSVNLHFSKLNGDVTGYGVSYGLNKDANQYADLFSYSGSLWTIDRNVSHLSPNTAYYFKVRAVNGCNAGGWSKTMKITTAGKGSTSKKAAVVPAAIQPAIQQPVTQPTLQPTPQPLTVSTVGPRGGGFWNAVTSFFRGLFWR